MAARQWGRSKVRAILALLEREPKIIDGITISLCLAAGLVACSVWHL